MTLGAFFVIEGIDGSGTTTQAALLSRRLATLGYEVLATREPTSGPVGQLLRAALEQRLDAARDQRHELQGPLELDWRTLALLFAADRMDHVHRTIQPHLSGGGLVVSDRYDLSSLIYQSETAPSPQEALPWLRALNGQAVRPSLTLVLDVRAELAERRRQARGGREELFEKQTLQRRLAGRYLQAPEIQPQDRVVVLPGEGSPDEVAAAIWREVEPHLPPRARS